MVITQEQFTSTIEVIRIQMHKDSENCALIEKVFPGSNVYVYDNSTLIKSLIDLLRIWFPMKDNFCEISHYCFELNFGKYNESEVITPEDLYNQLMIG